MSARGRPHTQGKAARWLSFVAAKFNAPEEAASHTESVAERFEAREREVVERFMTRPGRLLTVGCGAALAFAQRGFEVMAIDIAEKMIEQAKRLAAERGANIEFHTMSVTECEFPPQSFDYIFFSRAVYSDIPTRALRLATLARLRRMLTPSGLLVLSGSFGARRRLLCRRAIGRFAQCLATTPWRRSATGDTPIGRASEQSDLNKPRFIHISPGLAAIAEEIRQAGFSILGGGTHFYLVAQPVPGGNGQVRVVTNDAFGHLASELLAQGLRVRFTVSGTSMRPFLEEGDIVTLAPVTPADLKIGDIALVRRSPDSLTLHRLVRKMKGSQPLLVFKGDAVSESDEPVIPHQVIARVTEIQKAHKRISLQGWTAIARNWLLAQKSTLRAIGRRACHRMIPPVTRTAGD